MSKSAISISIVLMKTINLFFFAMSMLWIETVIGGEGGKLLKFACMLPCVLGWAYVHFTLTIFLRLLNSANAGEYPGIL
jgi:hypothetical protein